MAPQKSSQFILNIHECEETYLGIRLEFHQDVHGTLWTKIITQHRAKQAKVSNTVATAEVCDRIGRNRDAWLSHTRLILAKNGGPHSTDDEPRHLIDVEALSMTPNHRKDRHRRGCRCVPEERVFRRHA